MNRLKELLEIQVNPIVHSPLSYDLIRDNSVSRPRSSCISRQQSKRW